MRTSTSIAPCEVGALPLVLGSDSPEETLRAYVQLYLREEIKGEALVRNLAGFARFLPVAGLFHGQLLNVAGVARDAGVARTTVEGYLDVLEDTLLARRCRPTRRACACASASTPSSTGWTRASPARRRGCTARSRRRRPVPCSRAGSTPCFALTWPSASWPRRSPTGRRRNPSGSRSTSSCAAAQSSAPSRSRPPAASIPDRLAGLRAIGELPGLRRRILIHRGDRPTRTRGRDRRLAGRDLPRGPRGRRPLALSSATRVAGLAGILGGRAVMVDVIGTRSDFERPLRVTELTQSRAPQVIFPGLWWWLWKAREPAGTMPASMTCRVGSMTSVAGWTTGSIGLTRTSGRCAPR